MREQILILNQFFSAADDLCSKPIKMSYTFAGKVTTSEICINNARSLNQFAALEAKLQKMEIASLQKGN